MSLKASIICPICGEEIFSDYTACPYCGTTLVDIEYGIPPQVEEKEKPKANTICRKCGAELPEGSVFCGKCGTPVKRVCPKCQTELNDEQEYCPSCGAKYSELSENDRKAKTRKVEISGISIPKLDIKNNKLFKRIVAGIAAFVVILFVGMSYRTSKYKSDMENVSNLMLNSAANAEEAANLIRAVWYNTIYEKSDSKTDKYTKETKYSFYDDFNDSLNNLFSDPTFRGSITLIEIDQAGINKEMKSLKNPPKKYEDAYEDLKELYDNYYNLAELATNPTGSLKSFTEDFNEYDNAFIKSYDRMQSHFE